MEILQRRHVFNKKGYPRFQTNEELVCKTNTIFLAMEIKRDSYCGTEVPMPNVDIHTCRLENIITGGDTLWHRLCKTVICLKRQIFLKRNDGALRTLQNYKFFKMIWPLRCTNITITPDNEQPHLRRRKFFSTTVRQRKVVKQFRHSFIKYVPDRKYRLSVNCIHEMVTA